MRRVDAPPAGWYPDPVGRTRLRWWDGLDWTDTWRAPPSAAELLSYEHHEAAEAARHYVASPPPAASAPPEVGRRDAQEMITEVRDVARYEVNRAADLFSARARAATRDFAPLISDYTNRIVRWVRFAAIVATVLLVAWILFQVFAQASLFNWIGDRIDNVTNGDENGLAALITALVPAGG